MVSLRSMRSCKPLPYGQLTTALVPTVPSPCFLRQSSTVAKVRETFCVSFVLIRFVIGELLSEVGGRVGHGLVLAWFESYMLRLVFLDSSLQSPGQEKHFGILFVPLRVVLERKKESGKKMTIFDFFRIRFLGHNYLYSGGSGLSIDIHFVDIELSYDVLSPLPIVHLKHFNHPHPYIVWCMCV